MKENIIVEMLGGEKEVTTIDPKDIGIKLKDCYKTVKEPEGMYAMISSIIANGMLEMLSISMTSGEDSVEYKMAERRFRMMIVLVGAIGGSEMIEDIRKDTSEIAEKILNDKNAFSDINVN